MKHLLIAALGVVLIVGVVFYTQRVGKEPTAAPTVTASAPPQKTGSETAPAAISTEPVTAEPASLKKGAKTIDMAVAQRELVKAHTAFAIDLYKVLLKSNTGQNEFFSPYSISTILGLTTAG